MLHRLILVVTALCAGLVAAGPARAQRWDDYRRDRREHSVDRRWERDRWERSHGYGRPHLRPGYYAPPPVCYSPAPRPYYAPPPIYTPPGFGLFVPFR